MYLLGYDIGSSSVKASLVNGDTGKCVASAFYPKQEAKITAVKPGWAEQDPEMWWANLKLATADVMQQSGATPAEVKAIGISYQMHGLVCVDKNQKPLRDAIIWCDSRAVPYGNRAFDALGEQQCLGHLLNSPGNFTASKLAWVKENEPAIFEQIDKIMLPGDYIAMKLSGEICTTISGLSEGIFWDFKEQQVAGFLMEYFGFAMDLIPEIKPTFSEQGRVTAQAAAELGLAEGTPICYRAGDQPNNALSLNVFNPGEVAATAGTSGVVYGVLGSVNYDPLSRVNTFAHVNHGQRTTDNGQQTGHAALGGDIASLVADQMTKDGRAVLDGGFASLAAEPLTRLGVLLCINGTGILNSWMKRNVAPEGISYTEMNEFCAKVPIGAEGLSILPFGNGAERMLQNRETGCSVHGIQFNIHSKAHLLRAAQEGIVFSFAYGMEIMQQMGMEMKTIHAGHANMFLSPLFRDTLAGVTGATIELYDTDGSVGAAKGAGMGLGFYKDNNEAFASLEKIQIITPNEALKDRYLEAYNRWKSFL